MKELSLHVLDIAENALRAGATLIEIVVVEDASADLLRITVTDNGCGMDEETASKALDPFFTTKDVRKVGMGLSLFREAARRTGGDLRVVSRLGTGTTVVAEFGLSHIDRQPLGDLASTIVAILVQNPSLDVVLRHVRDGEEFCFDTRDLRVVLEDVPLNDPQVLRFVAQLIRERKQLA